MNRARKSQLVLDCSFWKILSNRHKFFDILIIFGGDIDNRSQNSKKVVFGGATSMLNFRELSEVNKTSSAGLNRPPICSLWKFCPGLTVTMATSCQSEVYWSIIHPSVSALEAGGSTTWGSIRGYDCPPIRLFKCPSIQQSTHPFIDVSISLSIGLSVSPPHHQCAVTRQLILYINLFRRYLALNCVDYQKIRRIQTGNLIPSNMRRNAAF